MASVIPFPTATPRQDASLADLQAQTRHDTRRTCMDCETLREESERIKRDYEERQQRIEVLMAGIHADVERA